MTDSMIEKVARAICIADGVDPDAEGCGHGVQMPAGEKYPLWKARLKQSRAAIQAMREPTDKMWNNSPQIAGENPSAAEIWRSMIDAALEETASI